MYYLQGEFRRFCFDSAVATFGSALEAELDKVTGKNAATKRQRLIDKWLDRPLKFREPSATVAKSTENTSSPTAASDTEFTISGDGSDWV